MQCQLLENSHGQPLAEQCGEQINVENPQISQFPK